MMQSLGARSGSIPLHCHEKPSSTKKHSRNPHGMPCSSRARSGAFASSSQGTVCNMFTGQGLCARNSRFQGAHLKITRRTKVDIIAVDPVAALGTVSYPFTSPCVLPSQWFRISCAPILITVLVCICCGNCGGVMAGYL
jgi:hypothetical protein